MIGECVCCPSIRVRLQLTFSGYSNGLSDPYVQVWVEGYESSAEKTDYIKKVSLAHLPAISQLFTTG